MLLYTNQLRKFFTCPAAFDLRLDQPDDQPDEQEERPVGDQKLIGAGLMMGITLITQGINMVVLACALLSAPKVE